MRSSLIPPIVRAVKSFIVPAVDFAPPEFHHANLPNLSEADFLHIEFDIPLGVIFVTPDDQTVVSFVPPVRRSGDIVRSRNWIGAVFTPMELLGMRDNPHMDV